MHDAAVLLHVGFDVRVSIAARSFSTAACFGYTVRQRCSAVRPASLCPMRKASAGGRDHEAEEIAAGGDARQLNASIQMSFAGIAPDGCRMVRPRGFARQPLPSPQMHCSCSREQSIDLTSLVALRCPAKEPSAIARTTRADTNASEARSALPSRSAISAKDAARPCASSSIQARAFAIAESNSSRRSRLGVGLNLKTAAKRGPIFAEVVAALPRRRPLGGPESYTSGTRPYPQNPQNPVLRVLRVPIHDPFLDQPPQWGFS